jgi:hypothetical protein
MKYLLILLWILRSDVVLSHEEHPIADLYVTAAAKEHNPTPRMERLRDEVFAELNLERQHPFYFADARVIMQRNVLGVCFPQSMTIIIDTNSIAKQSDRAIKLTIAHEIVHCYGKRGHISDMISMDQLLSDGDVYKYKVTFGIIDRMLMVLLGVDKCPASLMFPSGGYDKVCGPLMYEIYMEEAREAVKRK